MVIGEGEKMPAAFIQPDFTFLKEWCKRHNIIYTSNEEIIKNEQVVFRFKEEMETLNKDFANYEQVKMFELVAQPWTIDSGELTPTLKLKRKNILARYQNL